MESWRPARFGAIPLRKVGLCPARSVRCISDMIRRVRPKSTSKMPRVEPRIDAVRASIDELFPFHLAFDRSFAIVQVGRSLKLVCPEAVPGARLDRIFKGTETLDTEKVVGERRAHLTLRIPRTKLALRGLVVESEQPAVLVFLPSVWPSGSQEIEALSLDATDFAPFDPTFEYLQALSAREALQGRRKPSEVLAEQRAELRLANRRLEALYGISQILKRTGEVEDLLDDVLKVVVSAVRPKGASFWSCDAAGLELGAYLDAASRSREGPSSGARVRVERVRANMARVESDGDVAYPVPGAGGIVGVLDVEGPPSDEDADQLLEEIARKIGDAIDARQATEDLVRARDEAQAATRLKSAFLTNMSHEVRTPLNAIIGMMDLVLAGDLGKAERDYVLMAQAAGRDLLRIVNDILDFSKVEAGQIEFETVDFDLGELVQRLVLQYGAIAREKKLGLLAHFDPATPRWLRGDPSRMGQVLGNLLGNAIKFTDKGEVSFSVRPESKGRIRFEILDTGPGVAKAARSTLFLPFRQADNSSTRRFGGTGLGLAIAGALVERMGGKIDLASTLGQGSRFWFSVPLEIGKPPSLVAPPEESNHDDDTASRRSRRTILVAEDNPVNQRLLRGFLEHLEYDVHIVDTGERVVEAYRAKKFAAILMDWQMPVMDGLEATARIRRLEADGRRSIPIIALTAHAVRGDRERCLAAGMNDYLTKPVRLDELRSMLERWTRPSSVTKLSGPIRAVTPPPVGIDLAALQALGKSLDFADDPSLIAEVVGVYLEDAPSRIERIRSALAANDAREAARQAHTLKGASSNVSAAGMVQIAIRIEEACRKGRLADAVDIVREAAKELDRISPVLRDAVRS